jgi:hypothetical protein
MSKNGPDHPRLIDYFREADSRYFALSLDRYSIGNRNAERTALASNRAGGTECLGFTPQQEATPRHSVVRRCTTRTWLERLPPLEPELFWFREGHSPEGAN